MKASQLMVLLVTAAMLLAGSSCSQGGTPVPLITPTAATGTPVPAATGPAGPVIYDIKILDQLYDVLSIAWKTNEPTISQLEYGQTLEYGQSTAWTTEPSLFHMVIETGLVPYGTYHFRVRVKNAAGVEAVSEDWVIQMYHEILAR